MSHKKLRAFADSAELRKAIRTCIELGLVEKVAWSQLASDKQLWLAVRDCRRCISMGCSPESYAVGLELYIQTLNAHRQSRAEVAEPWNRKPQDTSPIILKAAIGALLSSIADSKVKREARAEYQRALALAETELLTRMTPREFENFMIGLYEVL